MNGENGDTPLHYAIRIHERANRDINTLYVWLAESSSPESADQWRDELYTKIAALSEFPRSHPLAPERFRTEVRQMLYRRWRNQPGYRILFLLSDEQSDDAPTVTIARVIHASARPLTRQQIREIEAGD